MGQPVTIRQAAAAFDVSVAAVQKWVREYDAPTARLGEPGRGRGTLFDIDRLRKWHAGRFGTAIAPPPEADMGSVARGIWHAYFKSPEGQPDSTWRMLRVPRRETAAVLVGVYREIYRAAYGKYPEDKELPAEMLTLVNVCAESSAHRTHAPNE